MLRERPRGAPRGTGWPKLSVPPGREAWHVCSVPGPSRSPDRAPNALHKSGIRASESSRSTSSDPRRAARTDRQLGTGTRQLIGQPPYATLLNPAYSHPPTEGRLWPAETILRPPRNASRVTLTWQRVYLPCTATRWKKPCGRDGRPRWRERCDAAVVHGSTRFAVPLTTRLARLRGALRFPITRRGQCGMSLIRAGCAVGPGRPGHSRVRPAGRSWRGSRRMVPVAHGDR
jgi:hypothetical protein